MENKETSRIGEEFEEGPSQSDVEDPDQSLADHMLMPDQSLNGSLLNLNDLKDMIRHAKELQLNGNSKTNLNSNDRVSHKRDFRTQS